MKRMIENDIASMKIQCSLIFFFTEIIYMHLKAFGNILENHEGGCEDYGKCYFILVNFPGYVFCIYIFM